MMLSDKKLRARVIEKLPLLVMILFVIQPLMDVLSFWMAQWAMSNTLTLLLRLAVLAVTVLAGFLLSRRKKVYYIAAAVCLVVGLGHIFACVQFGYRDVVGDLANYVRVLQLPLTVLCLITFIRANEKCYGAMGKGVALALAVILAVQVLAIVTGTEPHTYDDGRGLIGWFANTNTQSAIVSMAAPVAVAWLYKQKGLKSVWLWISLLGASVSMFYFGTRLAYLGIFAMCFGLAVSMVIIRLKDWKKACVLLLVGILFIALFPLSPMTNHRGAHGDEMGIKDGWIQNMLDNPKPTPTPTPTLTPGADPTDTPEPTPTPTPTPPAPYDPSTMTEEERMERLIPVYNHFISDMVEVFGVERVIEMYHYTTDISVLSDLRAKKLMVAEILMEESPWSAKVFGIELSRFTMKGHIYDVENDFHGIYYLYGAVGLAALVLFLAWFFFLIVRALIKNFKRYFTLEAAALGIALIMGLAHAYFTAGVLRRPSASFYLAAVLAGVYYLVQIKKYPDEIEV